MWRLTRTNNFELRSFYMRYTLLHRHLLVCQQIVQRTQQLEVCRIRRPTFAVLPVRLFLLSAGLKTWRIQHSPHGHQVDPPTQCYLPFPAIMYPQPRLRVPTLQPTSLSLLSVSLGIRVFCSRRNGTVISVILLSNSIATLGAETIRLRGKLGSKTFSSSHQLNVMVKLQLSPLVHAEIRLSE
jgi:hypothetical protein